MPLERSSSYILKEEAGELLTGRPCRALTSNPFATKWCSGHFLMRGDSDEFS